jgi:hypothetical protein
MVANAGAALHWLEEDSHDTKRAASLIEIALRDGMSIGSVMCQIRELFRAQSPGETPFEPNDLVRQVALVLGKDLDAKGMELSVDLEPQLCEVALDPIQIQ